MSVYSNSVRYKANPDFILREIAGEILLVPVGEQTKVLNGMVTFSETGAFIWKHLDGQRGAEEFAQLLAAECGVDAETILPDIEVFLQKAVERGLLIEA